MRPIAIVASFLCIVFAVAPSFAQTWPTMPVRILVPGPAGGPTDIRARWVADKLAPVLGQPVVVDPRPGAGGNIAMEAAARSPADGHTLIIVHPGTMAQNPHLYARTGYDALNDFAPVIQLVDSVLMMAVNPEVPAKSVLELIALARQKPGQLFYGSPGVGTPPHLAGELFKKMADIDVVHVPYKGSTPALADLLGGRIAYTIEGPPMQLPHVATGRLRALAVTGKTRSANTPDIPTMDEAGVPGFEYRSWMGIVAPAATPRPIVLRLNAILAQALREPDSVKWYAAQGGEVVGGTPEEFMTLIRAEHARWGKVIREAGIKAE